MATLGYSGTFDTWWYSGVNTNNYVTTVNSGAETMTEAGYVNTVSCYVNGFGGGLGCELFVYSNTQGKYLIVTSVQTAPAGSKSVGGQTWVNVGVGNVFIPKGESLCFGWWRYSGQDSVWSTKSLAGHEWDAAYQPTAPDSGGTLPASHSANGGSAIGAYITYSPAAPILNSLSIANGHVGDVIQVYGNAFTSVSAVKVNGVAASFSIASDTQLSVTIPAGAAVGPVSATNPNGTGSGPTFYTQPVVNSVSPNPVSTGATLTINGTGLTGASNVNFATAGGVTPTVVSDSQITVVVPAGATAGALTVYVPGGNWVTGTENIQPTLSAFTPATAAIGQTVTLTGTGFNGATNVTFNGVGASFSVVSPTSITATVPSGATVGKIRVTDTGGYYAETATSFTPVTRRFWRAGAWKFATAVSTRRTTAWATVTQIESRRAGVWKQNG